MGLEEMTVSDLIILSSWNRELIMQVFWQVDWDAIWSLPINSRSCDDRLVLHYQNNGSFSVRSSYHLEMNSRCEAKSSMNPRDVSWCSSLWSATMPNKVKIHVWRAYFDAIPARTNFEHRSVFVLPFCPRCSRAPEDTTHALWSCPAVQAIWKASALWNFLKGLPGGPFNSLCSFLSSSGNKEDIGFGLFGWGEIAWHSRIETKRPKGWLGQVGSWVTFYLN
ncbi:hypothetical protein TIFTF001_012092 [Ficus carica]|uniref:Reverse transcriptase zinc-binding domain-containing protein n=1 Tax=Ficus carica TaxID=3494 RepID=A0AA88D3E5_FICCA|nr:hypothetical protein TIFTF001_012092 [Ficus carica]